MKPFPYLRFFISGIVLILIATYSRAQEIPSDSKPDTINAQKTEDKIDLGYIKMDRKYVTSSVSVIKKEINTIPSADINKQMQGLASGITVIGDGQPSSVASVMIRGGFTPYYVVDGVPVHNISGLNSSDIESITILKDGAAAIYGMRSMNGVILINTKKGNAGLHVSYNMTMGMQFPGRGNSKDLLNTREYAKLQWLVYKNDGLDGTVDGPDADNLPDYRVHPIYGSSANAEPTIPGWAGNTDWYDALTDNAPMMKHDLAISGAGSLGRFYLNFGYLKQNGIVIHNYAERYYTRLNAEISLFKGHLKIGENFGFDRQSDLRLSTRNHTFPVFLEMLRLQPIVPVRVTQEIEGTDRTFMPGDYGGSGISDYLGYGMNVVAWQERNKEDEYLNNNYTGNIYGEVQILNGLSLKSSYGISQYKVNILDFTFKAYENSGGGGISRAYEDERKSKMKIWSNTLNFDRQLGIHRIQSVLGYEEYELFPEEYNNAEYYGDFDSKAEYGHAEKVFTEGSYHYEDGIPQKALFARVDYGLLDRYFLGATIRQDKGLKGQWQADPPFYYYSYDSHEEFYPSVMAGWSVGNEPFMAKIPWINELKIRASYGKTGDMNKNWQYSETTDIGFESSLIKNHFGITMDWFKTMAKDILIDSYYNSGEYKYTGTDVNINYKMSGTNFGFSANLAFSTYKSQINKIGDGFDYYLTGDIPALQYVVRNEKGHPLSSFYGYRCEGVFNDDDEVSSAPVQGGAKPGTFRYANIDGENNVIDNNDRTFIGNPNPDFTVGLNINMTFKNFDLNMLFYASEGNDVFNYTKFFTDLWFPESGQKSKDLLYNSWTETNRNADLPEATMNFSLDASSFYIEDASYLRMKNLQLGYNFSPGVLKSFKMTSLRVYLQAVNLFTITGYSGLDPEVGGERDSFGIDMGTYPNTKQFLFGLQVEI